MYMIRLRFSQRMCIRKVPYNLAVYTRMDPYKRKRALRGCLVLLSCCHFAMFKLHWNHVLNNPEQMLMVGSRVQVQLYSVSLL